MTKDEVHDQLISPLVMQLVDVCARHGIAMLVNFSIPLNENEHMNSVSMIPDGDGRHPEAHCLAIEILTEGKAKELLQQQRGTMQ